MMVFDKNIALVCFFIMFFLDFFRFLILIRGSFGHVLGIEHQFFVIEKSEFNEHLHFFDIVIDCLIDKSIFRFKKNAKTIGKRTLENLG